MGASTSSAEFEEKKKIQPQTKTQQHTHTHTRASLITASPGTTSRSPSTFAAQFSDSPLIPCAAMQTRTRTCPTEHRQPQLRSPGSSPSTFHQTPDKVGNSLHTGRQRSEAGPFPGIPSSVNHAPRLSLRCKPFKLRRDAPSGSLDPSCPSGTDSASNIQAGFIQGRLGPVSCASSVLRSLHQLLSLPDVYPLDVFTQSNQLCSQPAVC